jgi:hypothetical protein
MRAAQQKIRLNSTAFGKQSVQKKGRLRIVEMYCQRFSPNHVEQLLDKIFKIMLH